MRQRIAGGSAPITPRSVPVTNPMTAMAGVMVTVKAPMENGMVWPSSRNSAMAEARSVPVKVASRLSWIRLARIASRVKPT